ncbi:MAG TPA: TatD family hydrolase [Halanaerobiales bacterium]|nr:TatD family hydrolase [Halanaerobiales bacterium]
MELVDTHAHLDFPRFDKDRKEVIKRAIDGGVKIIVNIGSSMTSSRNSVELSRRYNEIYSVVGIHPHNADSFNLNISKKLKSLSENKKVVAIGEIGLDFHYDNSPREKQKQAFRAQLRLAKSLDLPVVIHTRDADEETLEILKEENADKIGGIMHCFASDKKMAREILDLGFYIAFGGLITFKNLNNLREVVKEVPINKILVETDAPYLTPDPYRGKRNEPLYVKYVAEKISEIKGLSKEEIAKKTTQNAKKVYNI